MVMRKSSTIQALMEKEFQMNLKFLLILMFKMKTTNTLDQKPQKKASRCIQHKFMMTIMKSLKKKLFTRMELPMKMLSMMMKKMKSSMKMVLHMRTLMMKSYMKLGLPTMMQKNMQMMLFLMMMMMMQKKQKKKQKKEQGKLFTRNQSMTLNSTKSLRSQERNMIPSRDTGKTEKMDNNVLTFSTSTLKLEKT